MTNQQRKFDRPLAPLRRLPVTFLIILLFGGTAWCASSPFELEIGDLERDGGRNRAAKGETGSGATGSRVRAPVDPGLPTAEDLEGEFLVYTVRPGDNLFTVLTNRFGLSSARAEEIIPRILRVNGIRDIRGLRIGRAIRIPASVKRTAGKAPSIKPAIPATTPTTPTTATPATTDVSAPPARQPEAPSGPIAPEPKTPEADESPKAVLVSITASDPSLIADSILDALSISWSKAHPVAIPVGGSGGATLTVPVDRYFEEGEKRFFLDFGGSDPGRATLTRLVELAGFRRIAVNANDGFRTIADRILEALEIRSEYRNHNFSPGSGAAGGADVPGYLLVRPGGKGETLFMTDLPLEKRVTDPAGAGQWEIK